MFPIFHVCNVLGDLLYRTHVSLSLNLDKKEYLKIYKKNFNGNKKSH